MSKNPATQLDESKTDAALEFRRRRTSDKHRKEWRTKQGYRIEWRDQTVGVSVPACYYATVRTLTHNRHECWDFVGRRGPYKTLNKAKEECNHHRDVWLQMLDVAVGEPKGRADAIRALEFRSRVTIGTKKKVKMRARIMLSLPVWVNKTVRSRIVDRIMRVIAPVYVEREIQSVGSETGSGEEGDAADAGAPAENTT